ncbi:MAG: DUF4276 family protein [Planctomycetota bacterium]
MVEGKGEIEAVPVLLRRLADRHGLSIRVRPPIRLPRGKLVQQTELAKAVQLAAKQGGTDGGILFLLDADDDCPADLGPRLLGWGRAARADRLISVVIANREFEAWFLAAAQSIAGRRGLAPDLSAPSEPETVRDAKGWLGERMGRRHSPTVDQAAFAAVFDLDLARTRSPSLDKVLREFEGWL